MHYIQTILAIIFIIFFILFIFMYLLSIFNSIKYKVPQVWTFKSDFKVMRKYLSKYNLEWKNIVDLWSWTWKALRFFEKEFKMKTTWYEIDLANVIIAKILNYINWNSWVFSVANYLEKDLSQFDCIYIYLFPKIINNIEKKIWEESKDWTIIISNAFKFKNHSPIEVLKDDKWKEEIYIYKVNLQ